MKTNNSTTTKKTNTTDKAVEKFAQTMIKTIEGLQQGWRKGWMSETPSGQAQNLSGREYTAMNQFFLLVACSFEGYELPVYATCNQINKEGCHVNKGEQSYPVFFWKFIHKDKNGNNISDKDWEAMTAKEKEECESFPILKYYPVFNLSQTNFAEKHPEKYEKLKEKFSVGKIAEDTDGMYVNDSLDTMFASNSWVCPIYQRRQSDAYYNRATDVIVLPTKEQFKKNEDVYTSGMEFYATALHEMAHSTGAPNRLNREKGGRFGDKAYGKEELVAEMTAAMVGHRLGFSTSVTENNAAYLSSWLKTIKQEPKFLISVLSDVSKASNMINEAIEKCA